MNFLKTFTRYDVVVVADDNGARHPGCVQVSDAACAAAGFSDMNFTIGKKVSGCALLLVAEKLRARLVLGGGRVRAGRCGAFGDGPEIRGRLALQHNLRERGGQDGLALAAYSNPDAAVLLRNVLRGAGVAPTASTNRRVRAGLQDALFSGGSVSDAVRGLGGSKPPRIGEYYLPERIRPSGSAILVPPRKTAGEAR